MTDAIEFEPHRARRYRKRSEILAFLSHDAVTYYKSFGRQDLPPGGWVAVALDNDGNPNGEVYGIDEDAFAETYAPSPTGIPNRYMKTATIEAYQPGHAFFVSTVLDDKSDPDKKKVEVERSEASATAMLVRNPGGEVYPIELEQFDRLYVEVITPKRATSRDEHMNPALGPKRILSLDGGGARSILTLGALEEIERHVRERHGDARLTLADYFDLIAGTSTGSVLAAGLAAGRTVSEMIEWYRPLAPRLFAREWTPPLVRPKHDPGPLKRALKAEFSEMRFGSDELRTGLLILTKRLDARGVQSLSNNSRDPLWAADTDQKRPGTADFLLREVLRASAAAPFPLQPDKIRLYEGRTDLGADRGVFINSGISPHNNPALQALLLAARNDHGLGWKTGAESLLMVSVGAGTSPTQHQLRGMSIPAAVESLHRILNEAAAQIETMMQWLSESDTSRVIDPQLGSLRGELLTGQPLISYARYDAQLDSAWLQDELGLAFSKSDVAAMQPLDAQIDAVDHLLEVGRRLGMRRVSEAHFPEAFDLPARDLDDEVEPAASREDQAFVPAPAVVGSSTSTR